MESLKVYVSKCQKLLTDKRADLYTTLGVYGYLFPESNQHPVHQAKWIKDLLIREDLGGMDLAIFTHSSTIISCIGDYIEEVDNSFRDKVEIIILHESGSEQNSTFDKEGFLVNWEIGFFSGR